MADSRMVNLRGQFALVLLAEVPNDAVDALRRELEASGRTFGLTA